MLILFLEISSIRFIGAIWINKSNLIETNNAVIKTLMTAIKNLKKCLHFHIHLYIMY